MDLRRSPFHDGLSPEETGRRIDSPGQRGLREYIRMKEELTETLSGNDLNSIYFLNYYPVSEVSFMDSAQLQAMLREKIEQMPNRARRVVE